MRCQQVPELEVPPGIVPSGKYVVVVDENGDSKMLARITGKGILYFDGDNAYWASGDSVTPILLPDINTFQGPAIGILARDSTGWIRSMVSFDPGEKVLKSKDGAIFFEAVGGVGESSLVPGTGHGVLARQIENGPTAFFGLQGLVYIDGTGGVTRIPDGSNGQFLAIDGVTPVFRNLPAGNIASGSGVATLEGVAAGSLTPGSVNIAVPLMRLTDGVTDIQVANVNVNFDFANGAGVNNGLDVGAEQASTWYYLYIISDSTTVACVASESMMAPDLTAFGAFQFYGFVGVFRNDAAGNIVTYVQRGRDISTPQVVMTDGASITTSMAIAPATVSPLTAIVPPIAKSMTGIAGGSAGANATNFLSISVAADAGGLGLQFIGSSDHAASVDGFKKDAGTFYRLPILDGFTPAIYWKANANDLKRRISITGYSI